MSVDEMGACSVANSVVRLAWSWADGMVVMWVVQTDKTTAVRMAACSAGKKVAWMDEMMAASMVALSVVLKAARSAVYWAALMDMPWVDETDASKVVRMAARSVAWWAALMAARWVASRDVMKAVC